MPILFDFDDREPLEPRKEPSSGWKKPCLIEDHRWGIELEDGHASIVCLDPCDPESFENPGTTGCTVDWPLEDFFTSEPIPVRVVYVDDSTPSTPNGPAEYGYYITVHPITSTERGEDG